MCVHVLALGCRALLLASSCRHDSAPLAQLGAWLRQPSSPSLQSLQRLQASASRESALPPPSPLCQARSYVPWVVLNGVAIGEPDESFYKYICVALEGDK